MQVPKDQPSFDLIGRPLIHTSALKQASGEAVYCDDIARVEGELYLALVMSTTAHARIIAIDKSKAMNLEGVVAYFDANDIPKSRRYFGPIHKDDEIFASEIVITN
jgi:xanthine dehydrogenase/oxidase